MVDENPSPNDPSGIGDRPQDAYVSERLTGPSEVPARTLELSGLLGDSDRPGYRRLYFTKQLDYYAEFASADVVAVETLPKGQAPFIGLEATTVTLRRDATVSFTQVASAAAPIDEFDLDVRLGREYGAAPTPGLQPQTRETVCGGPDTVNLTLRDTHLFAACTAEHMTKYITELKKGTCAVTEYNTLRTVCPGATCNQATCGTCVGQATCQTCVGQATCQTCGGLATCDTCQTCGTCDTCNLHICPR
jgi:hypothetical protein